MGADAIIHRASPGEGISLADVLDQYDLSVQQKVSLAHSVALAFWQYYDSQLVNRAWTSDTIWLMPEPDPDPEDSSERLPLRAYIEFYPEAIECAYDASEFIMTHVLVHRCPRIQYLALVLLQIGLGRPFRGSSFHKDVLRLNTDYSVALKYLKELKSATWNFEHKHIFDDSIEECLKFIGLMGKDEHPDTNDRRRQIYERVVSPLGWLNRSFQRTDAEIDHLSTKRHALAPKLDDSDFKITSREPLSTSHPTEGAVEMKISEIRPADRQGFETAIFCALPLEVNPIEALFDHHWEDQNSFYGKAPGDTNAYSTGVIGRHNVVLIHMSGMGKLAAAAAAACCRISFQNIKLAILVGVCGAVPVVPRTRTKINLGDVIISDGVIQYDFGRQHPDRFERKGMVLDSLGRAGLEVRSTLNKLKTHRGIETLQCKMEQHLESLRKKKDLKATYPATGDSKLSERSRYHPTQNEVNTPAPTIHFGLVASGDAVMKSAEHRDEIVRRDETIAFEMEGAAVWETFPCLIIKGACDYADSLKTKVFQPYAAATAAACTRAFLDSWECGDTTEAVWEKVRIQTPLGS
ncbi:hypothetical protein CEP51_003486 [Fusarium floridanum]|uniref:Uncharacterized protein n=1 Tax=Fusarium floridanum TaxID=1325733 RepID=A0A428S5N9_9HYPO|nr:hypothetical protein CEP51_003486 [Fusarium floridanum]